MKKVDTYFLGILDFILPKELKSSNPLVFNISIINHNLTIGYHFTNE